MTNLLRTLAFIILSLSSGFLTAWLFFLQVPLLPIIALIVMVSGFAYGWLSFRAGNIYAVKIMLESEAMLQMDELEEDLNPE